MSNLRQLYIEKTRVTRKALESLWNHSKLNDVASDLIPWQEREQFWGHLPTIKKIKADQEATRKRLEEARKKGFVPSRTVILHTFEAGEVNEDGKITNRTVIPYNVGQRYGYGLTIHNIRGNTHVKEILELPGPTTRLEGETADREFVKVLTSSTSDDKKTHIQEYELQCNPDKWLEFSQFYTIRNGHPRGPYRFTIYLNGEIAQKAEFILE
jgi:hypothetical protein